MFQEMSVKYRACRSMGEDAVEGYITTRALHYGRALLDMLDDAKPCFPFCAPIASLEQGRSSSICPGKPLEGSKKPPRHSLTKNAHIINWTHIGEAAVITLFVEPAVYLAR